MNPHDEREAIDAALVEHRPFRAIARQFGTSKDALLRHHDNHLPADLIKAHEAADVARADDLLAQVVDLKDRSLGILDKAEACDDLRAAIAAIREARGCVELLGKLAGQLKDAPTINLFVSEEWRTVQASLLAALEPYADARLAVTQALATVDYAGRA